MLRGGAGLFFPRLPLCRSTRCLRVFLADEREKEKNDLGQATQTIEVRKTLSIEDVRVELEEMKREAIDVDVEDL